jgi:hypothetical protein
VYRKTYVILIAQQLSFYDLGQITNRRQAMHLRIRFVQANWQNNIIRNFSVISKELWNILWTLWLCSVTLHIRMTIVWKFKIRLCCSGAFAKLRKATISFVISDCPSVRPSDRPHATTRLALDVFQLNSIFEYFSKICCVSLKSYKNGYVFRDLSTYQNNMIRNF